MDLNRWMVVKTTMTFLQMITATLIIGVGIFINFNEVEKEITPQIEWSFETVNENLYKVTEEVKLKAIEEAKKIEEAKPKLNLQTINNNYNVFQPSNLTTEQLQSALNNTYGAKLAPHASTFIHAEKEYSVNAIYLASTIALESGWGKYTTGSNNIAGWTLSRGGYRSFSSRDDCILYVARNLSSDYKPRVGEKLKDVTGRYCPEPTYPGKVKSIMNILQTEIKGAL